MYYEDYDGQDGTEFDELEYYNVFKTRVVVPVSDNLESQVAEIIRCNGATTRVRLLRKEA